MASTLRELLAVPPVRRGRPELLSGADQLDRTVRWVHVSEVPDVPALLSGGELILTVGHPLVGPEERVAAYVEGLAAAGACGLVVELGKTLAEVPAAAVVAARALDFPVVVLHDQVRFVEITELAHREIVAEQYAFVEFARATHETFTQLSLQGASVQQIVDATADLCDSSVVLEDLARTVLAHRARGRPASGLLARWEHRSRLAPSGERTGLAGDEGWMVTPVGVHHQVWGRLVVPDPRTAQDRLSMVLERAAQALELNRMAERDRRGLELQAQGGLLLELLTRSVVSEAEAVARAGALGMHTADRYLAVVVQRSRRAEGPDDPVSEHGSGRRLLERVATTTRSVRLSCLVGSLRSDQVGVLLGLRETGTEGADRAAEDRLLATLTDALPNTLVVGVGRGAPTLVAAGAGLGQAQHVAEVAAALPPARDRRWFRTTDVRLHGLVALLHDDPRVQAFTEAELGPLLEHEAAHDGGLLDLLRQYVAVGGNKSRLAQASHRSRSSVYARLARLEGILGVGLDDPDSLLSLGVALMAHDHASRSAAR